MSVDRPPFVFGECIYWVLLWGILVSVYIGFYYGDTSNINHTLYRYFGAEVYTIWVHGPLG